MLRNFFTLGFILMISTNALATNGLQANVSDGKFKNSEIDYKTELSSIWKITKAYLTDDRESAVPDFPIPVIPVTRDALLNLNHDAIIRLGHSSVLLKIDGEFVLLDPVFSERAFAVEWLGPKRFHDTPISIDELPPIKAVIISHDHYDHLDKSAIKKLAHITETFVTPLKVGNHLRKWGVPNEQIVELNWWQSTSVSSMTFTATPSQHFSGRGLFDKDKTLWASWVIKGENTNLFFSGDSGYFGGFKDIGERFGPFDLTLIETGAYNDMWSEIHMLPEQSLQAHIDVKGHIMMPIHNSTFDLALHNWFEPLEKITQLANEKQVTVSTPKFGEVVNINQLPKSLNVNNEHKTANDVSSSTTDTHLKTATESGAEAISGAPRPWWYPPLM
ncbi:MBL fold metallo-hydrolase [Alteromonas lipotrueae]|uniref:MBL fold metallo-hydrolase n=1 Tax=Alteromonas lipotrueae TaxID=2803814 RepID=UPI001C4543BF|nr:MBL fold metallo-hydrolase [Alteromonas lipotrueae]